MSRTFMPVKAETTAEPPRMSCEERQVEAPRPLQAASSDFEAGRREDDVQEHEDDVRDGSPSDVDEFEESVAVRGVWERSVLLQRTSRERTLLQLGGILRTSYLRLQIRTNATRAHLGEDHDLHLFSFIGATETESAPAKRIRLRTSSCEEQA
jgi:hypothetical protein